MNRTMASFCILLALAVILGAFGSHALEHRISPEYLDTYKTASFYHFLHALGGLVINHILTTMHSRRNLIITNMFLLGIVLFCGSLYMLSMWELFEYPGLKKLGAVTPVGGILFFLAWSLTAFEFIQIYRASQKDEIPDE